MTGPWLSVVGIGEDGLAGLGEAARRLIARSQVLVGGARHLALVPVGDEERLAWPTPFDALVDQILARRGRRVVVLASGDPMHYGVGALLSRHVAAEEVVVVPAPGAFALATARLGWAGQAVETLSLHGRPLELLAARLWPGARLLALSADATTPAKAAELLSRLGWGPSRLIALERMGSPAERRLEGAAGDWSHADVGDLNVLAIECEAEPGTRPLPLVPGLPDEAFRHDGQLTKREVRAVTLAALAPMPGQMLWDIGAGCGSVGIEWMRAHPACRAVGVEPRAHRLALAAANAQALGVPGLVLVEGRAPEALGGLARPDAVFVGGGVGAPGLLETCWRALAPGGRLVANAVTLEGEQALAGFFTVHGGALTRLSVARAGAIGGLTGWSPLRAVTQLAVWKS